MTWDNEEVVKLRAHHDGSGQPQIPRRVVSQFAHFLVHRSELFHR